VELDRALALLAGADDGKPLPPAAALRLEWSLRQEERRLARRGAVRIGLHALAFAACFALLVSAWILSHRRGVPNPGLSSAASAGALIAVVLSLWNLVRAVDGSAVPS